MFHPGIVINEIITLLRDATQHPNSFGIGIPHDIDQDGNGMLPFRGNVSLVTTCSRRHRTNDRWRWMMRILLRFPFSVVVPAAAVIAAAVSSFISFSLSPVFSSSN